MTALDVQIGSTIMSSMAAVRVQRRGETGWLGLYVSLGTGPVFLTGTPALVPFEDLPGWRHVPFEWTPCPGGAEEERYVWTRGCHALRRETQPGPATRLDELVRFYDNVSSIPIRAD